MGGHIQLFTFICFLVSILLHYLFYKEVKLLDYCDCNSKPVIYGEEFCKNILEGNVVLSENYFQKLINLVSSKIFFQGKFDNRNIVLKTTTSFKDVKNVENEFSKILESVSTDLDNNVLFIKSQIVSSISIPLGSSEVPKLRLCPHNSYAEDFFNKIPGFDQFGVDDYLQLWTIVHCNPEPLILKILDPNVWPVPKYYGSCGRLIVVEDCGLTLTHYYDSDWNQRANITYQLLKNAFKFTFEDPDFAFYLTDISPDNIAVTQDGIVKYVDLEHIILVNKQNNGIDGWLNNHTSKHYECPNCLTFEADEICSHHISDHNIYAVCKEILSDSELLPGGFLHSINISQLYLINQFIEDCLHPKESHRFETAEKILYLLQKYS